MGKKARLATRGQNKLEGDLQKKATLFEEAYEALCKEFDMRLVAQIVSEPVDTAILCIPRLVVMPSIEVKKAEPAPETPEATVEENTEEEYPE